MKKLPTLDKDVDATARLSAIEKRLEDVEDQFHFLNHWMHENLPVVLADVIADCRFGASRSVD